MDAQKVIRSHDMAITKSFTCRTPSVASICIGHDVRQNQKTTFLWVVLMADRGCPWFTVGEINFENSLSADDEHQFNHFSSLHLNSVHLSGGGGECACAKRRNDIQTGNASMQKLWINLFLNKMFIWTRSLSLICRQINRSFRLIGNVHSTHAMSTDLDCDHDRHLDLASYSLSLARYLPATEMQADDEQQSDGQTCGYG